MDFSAIQFFLFLYFIRPQDWVPGMAGLRLVTLNMALAILFTINRPGGFSLGTLFKTPHDWVMLAYFCWVVGTAPDKMETFGDAKSLFIFYFVTMLALSSWERLSKLLSLWTILLLIVAGLSLASLFGLDITGAAPITASQKGRLVLNTWMLNNPNALGHTVIAALPLTYFNFFWRREATSKVLAPLWFALAGACVYWTESKGAYLVGAVTLLVSQIPGRGRLVQIIMFCFAATAGVALLTQLPRMQTLSRSDPGIQGRLMAWQSAREAMQQHDTGVGWKKFTAHFKWEKQWIELATHGSYVQIGAALGYGGLFLYLGVLYCGFRTLVQARTETDEEERARRILFSLLISYALSSWMIDRAYYTEFFVIAAAIAAFHRLCAQRTSDAPGEEEQALADRQGLGIPGAMWPVPTLAMGSQGKVLGGWNADASLPSMPIERPAVVPSGAADEADQSEASIAWKRLGIIDLLLIYCAFKGVLAAWDHILKSL